MCNPQVQIDKQCQDDRTAALVDDSGVASTLYIYIYIKHD